MARVSKSLLVFALFVFTRLDLARVSIDYDTFTTGLVSLETVSPKVGLRGDFGKAFSFSLSGGPVMGHAEYLDRSFTMIGATFLGKKIISIYGSETSRVATKNISGYNVSFEMSYKLP